MRYAEEIEIALFPRPEGMRLHRWLYEEIRAAILGGRLMPGERLPATRDLARHYGLSRGTVLSAFDQLIAEGYLVARVGRGSFVASQLPDQRPQGTDTANLRGRPAGISSGLSERGQLLARSPYLLGGRTEKPKAFRPCLPDVSAFPSDVWTRIAARRSKLTNWQLLADNNALGFYPLRQAIAVHIRMTRGICCSAEQIAILGSLQQVIDLSTRLLLDPGESVWMEDPGYPGARMVMEAAGAKVVAVPVDAKGLDVTAGRTRAPSARLVYVSAGRQWPLGMPLALERRLELLAWVNEKEATIIEDDYDSEYRFEGAPLAAMKSLDAGDRVIYAGTFSKLLFPSLRLAFAVLPDRLVDPFAKAISLTMRHVSVLPQAVLNEFIVEGHFGRHLRRMRLHYAERAHALQKAANDYLGGILDLPDITMGLDTPAFLPAGVNDQDAARIMAEKGIECRPLSLYAQEEQAPFGLVLGFAAITPQEIDAAAINMARILEAFIKRNDHCL